MRVTGACSPGLCGATTTHSDTSTVTLHKGTYRPTRSDFSIIPLTFSLQQMQVNNYYEPGQQMKLQYGVSLYLVNGEHALERTHTRTHTLSLGHFPFPPRILLPTFFALGLTSVTCPQTCRRQDVAHKSITRPGRCGLLPVHTNMRHQQHATFCQEKQPRHQLHLASGICPGLPLLWNLDFSASAIAHQRTDGDIDGATWASVKLLESESE